jgi:hypothetical protein
MEDKSKLIAVALVPAFVLCFTVVGCGVYDNEVLPQRMADKGFCWQKLPDMAAYAYAPCRKASEK